jgi:hypothetical protein
MTISETPMPPEAIAGISAHAREGRALCGVVFGGEPTDDDSRTVVDWVDHAISEWQRTGLHPDLEVGREDMIGVLGFTWGEQIVAAHGWQWVNLTFHEHNDWQTIAVVSTDRLLMILPFAFIYECLDRGADVTIGMSIRAIGSDVVPTLPPGGYLDLMHGLRRVVPKA